MDTYDHMTENDRRAVVAFVSDWGRHLDEQEEWSLDENLSAAEVLHDVYRRHIAPTIEGVSV